jgi:hypothetical protein
LVREITCGRHPRAGVQRAVADRCAELILDLAPERPTIAPVHRPQQLERLTGLV